ncbi:MAG: uroporphyrinogen decarboxylase family protein, partial [Candidatus Thorarchaeota archaeon]
MKPIERFLKAVSFEEPDKVPLFLLMTQQGADIMGMSSQTYFSSAESVVKGQILLQEKFQHDCLYPFFYAAKEYEAFGGQTLYKRFGPPESGRPVFKSGEELLSTQLPDSDHPSFTVIHKAHQMIVEMKGSELPILTSVLAPLSLPVMLLGFETWIE